MVMTNSTWCGYEHGMIERGKVECSNVASEYLSGLELNEMLVQKMKSFAFGV